ncbi:MAG: DUF4381 family protein [Bdellovibrionota bacterium]
MLFLLLLGFLAFAPAVQAQESVSQVPVQSGTEKAMVGDEIPLALELPPGESVIGEPRVANAPEGFALKGVRAVPPAEGASTWKIEIVLAPFDLKTKEIPPLEISYSSPSGEKRIKTQAVPFSIEPVLPEEKNEMMDIHGPLGVSLSWWMYLLYAMALAGAIWAALWFWRRRKQKEAPLVPAAPPVPPYEKALAALMALETEDLPRKGRSAEHCTRLSEILREYVEGRYEFPAREQTTGEIKSAFATVPALDTAEGKALVQQALSLLEEWDLIKFARLPIEEFRARQMLAETRRWVEETKPLPVVLMAPVVEPSAPVSPLAGGAAP